MNKQQLEAVKAREKRLNIILSMMIGLIIIAIIILAQ